MEATSPYLTLTSPRGPPGGRYLTQARLSGTANRLRTETGPAGVHPWLAEPVRRGGGSERLRVSRRPEREVRRSQQEDKPCRSISFKSTMSGKA